MSQEEYTAALLTLGMPPLMSAFEQDVWASKRLGVSMRTARRYRSGETIVPRWIEAALTNHPQETENETR